MYRLLITFAIVPIICSNGLLEFGLELVENAVRTIGKIASNDDDQFDDDLPTPEEIAERQGYTAETHKTVSKDGYILQMHRITGSELSPKDQNKPVVFLFHGLLDCSTTWVIGPTNKSLSYILADRGYDVWMGNARGNRYSRTHKTLTTSDKKYWQFSWHEIGVYDLPAMIDYALATTGQQQLIYVGHSQGCTSFFVMASMRPKYQEKIKAAITLAPAVFMGHATLPLIRFLAPIADSIKALADRIGMYEFMPTNEFVQEMVQQTCIDGETDLCGTTLSVLISPGEKLLNQTIASEMSKYDPAGSSTGQLVHYAQSLNTRRFAQYDYGRVKNLKLYNSEIPPDYPVENIKVPIYLHYSSNDGFVHPKDIEILYEKLPNREKFLVPEPSFTHIDFVWSEPLYILLNKQVVNQIASHT